MAGMDLYTLEQQGGWSDPKMVRRYAHLAEGHQLRAAQLLNGTVRVATLVATHP